MLISDAQRGCFLALVVLLPILGCTGAPPPAEPPESGPEESYREKEVAISSLTLGAGDEIEISVWRHPELDGKHTIDVQGNIYIPIAGAIQAHNLTPLELREKVVGALSEYLVKPEVTVTVTAYRSRKIFVLGEVRRPGLYNMGGEIGTLLGAIAVAGGMTDEANSNKVFVVRNGLEGGQREVFNVDRLLDTGDMSQNPQLNRGDIIYVPSSFIANVDRFFNHLQTILHPVVTLERAVILEPAVEDVLEGKEETGVTVIIPK